MTPAIGTRLVHSTASGPPVPIFTRAPCVRFLLKPGPQRETWFCVGTIAFDPQYVGLANDCNAPNAYYFDTSAPGNGNRGHEYGTLSDPRFPVLSGFQRAAVLEYLKTL